MADQGFENLEFYQDSLKLVKAAYQLASEFPDYERYNLADQLRRAVCSIVLNFSQLLVPNPQSLIPDAQSQEE